MIKIFKLSLLIIVLIAFKSCENNDENKYPSIENDFLGKSFVYYSFDGDDEYLYADPIFYDSRFPERPYDFINLMGSSLGTVNPIQFNQMGTQQFLYLCVQFTIV